MAIVRRRQWLGGHRPGHYFLTEGASGSAYADKILGDNDSRFLLTRNELDNVNLINGLQSFFGPGFVSFDGGNILLGGGGGDTITGGGGNDIIDGDAYLHVGLSKYAAGGDIIRQIVYASNGNTYDPLTGLGSISTQPMLTSQCSTT